MGFWFPDTKIFRKKAVIFVVLVLVLFFIRFFSERQLDDVHSGIDCDLELMRKADVYYVIPAYNGELINESPEWCAEILRMDRELAMHGVYHTYREFGEPRDSEYVNFGVRVFEDCFGQVPTRFKPPQAYITKENDWMSDRFDMDSSLNSLFHKVYHCGDTGLYPNWLVDLF